MSEQFPSIEGDVEREIAERSADGAEGLIYYKVFRAQGDQAAFADEANPVHKDNKAAVLQEALNRGLHPKEEPFLANVELNSVNRRGVETCDVRYGVEVEPAVIDVNHPEDTVEPAEFLQDETTADSEPADPQKAPADKAEG